MLHGSNWVVTQWVTTRVFLRFCMNKDIVPELYPTGSKIILVFYIFWDLIHHCERGKRQIVRRERRQLSLSRAGVLITTQSTVLLRVHSLILK